MREVMLDLRRRGATIVLSSHQMETVEKLCDRVALINRGEKVLDGAVSEVKARHGKNTVALAYDGDGAFIASLPGVAKVTDFGQYVEVRLDRRARIHSPCCRRRCRASACAGSRSWSRACTTSSWRP